MTTHVVAVKVYATVFAALLLLLALTVVVALVEQSALGLPIALGIAGLKGALIVMYFMHVRYDTPTVRLAAVAGFLWLCLLIGLSMSDLLTRRGPPATDTPATLSPGPPNLPKASPILDDSR